MRRAMTTWILSLFCAAASQIPTTGAAQAAVIREVDSPLCLLDLSGPIEDGDLSRLTAAVAPFLDAPERFLSTPIPYPDSTQGLRLCLDSPGGSLSEAARIAAYVFETGIGTVLAPEAQCHGACAWVFMMGFAQGAEDMSFTNRRMHYSADLTFQAPTLPIQGRDSLTAAEAQAALHSVTTAISDLLTLGNARILGSRPAIDADLLAQAFAHGGADRVGDAAFPIDTVDKAGRWRIEVFGIDWPDRLDPVAAALACTSLTRWPAARNATSPDVLGAGRLDNLDLRDPTEPDARALRVPGLDDGYFENTCLLDPVIRENGALGASVSACGINQGRGTSLGFQPCNFATSPQDALFAPYGALAIFSPETRLQDLPTASRALGDRVRGTWQAVTDPPLHRACTQPAEPLRVARVNEYATLRRSPGFEADILREVPLNTQVEITGDAVFAGEAARVSACRAACTAAGPDRTGPAPDVAACYLDNTIWLPALVAGAEGFMAGRYLAD